MPAPIWKFVPLLNTLFPDVEFGFERYIFVISYPDFSLMLTVPGPLSPNLNIDDDDEPESYTALPTPSTNTWTRIYALSSLFPLIVAAFCVIIFT